MRSIRDRLGKPSHISTATGPRAIRWRRLRARLLLAVALVVVVIVLGAAFRTIVLRSAGWLLVAQDPIEAADAIVVPEWTQEDGALEASDLVHKGVAKRVAVLVDAATDPSARELVRRQILPPHSIWIVKLLRSLGVEAVEEIPGIDWGTEAEGDALPSWCDQHRFRSIVVVSSPDHSRRVRRVLRRSMRGHPTKVIVRSTHYSAFDPDQWWKTRAGTRIQVVELEKLLLDVARHPIS